MTVDFIEYSNCGERSVNQDCVGSYSDGEFYVFTLCDGLGGHGGGEIASSAAVNAIIETAKNRNQYTDLIASCFENADKSINQKILENQNLKNMKTTATLLVFDNGKAQWAHIGDSRIYYFRKNKFVLRTNDHSVPQQLANMGEIKQSEIRRHPDRNKLLRCLPYCPNDYEVSEKEVKLSKRDSFVMMSDGFWDWINSKDIAKSLKKFKTARESADYLINLAFERGKGNNMDNLSLVIVRIS